MREYMDPIARTTRSESGEREGGVRWCKPSMGTTGAVLELEPVAIPRR
jgi:hypothetical protein